MNDLNEKVSEMEKKFTEGISAMIKPLEKIKEEIAMISIPKRKKDVTVQGNNCYISQTTDGRIIIHFATLEEADKYYDAFNSF